MLNTIGSRHTLPPIEFTPVPHTISSQVYFNGNVGSTAFPDNTGKVWTRVGTPSIVDSVSDPDRRVGYFDGAGDYITTPAHVDFAFGTADFAIEIWGNTISRNSSYEGLIDITSGTTISNGSRIAIFVGSDGNVFTEYRNTSGTFIGGNTVPGWTDNQHHHVVLERRSGVFYLALDGVFDAGIAYNINYSVNQKVRLGWPLNQVTAEAWYGHMDNFQVVKGASLYGTNFNPTWTRIQTLPLIVSQLNLNGANNSTVFTDTTSKAWSRSGTPYISTAHSWSDEASCYFDGTSDYIYTPNHVDLNPGAMDFTMEIRTKQQQTYTNYYPCVVSKRSSGSSNVGFVFWYNISGKRFVFTFSYDGGNPYTNGGEVSGPVNTQDLDWHHVAVCRTGQYIRLFCDGVSGPPFYIGYNAIYPSTQVMGLGTDGAGGSASATNCWKGWMDDFRYIRGVGLYTYNTPYVPPYYTLTNLDAELGDTTGWVVETGGFSVRTADPLPHSGQYYFFGSAYSSSIARYRIHVSYFSNIDATFITSGDIQVVLDWWQASWHPTPEDYGGLGLRFLDANATEISTTYSPLIVTQPELEWVKRSLTVVAPTNTRYIDIMYQSQRTAGTNNDTYVDDIEIQLVKFQ